MKYLVEVDPEGGFWNEFLELSYEYISESWPAALTGISKGDFLHEYSTSLIVRISQGGRGLFLYKDNSNTLGLANVYLDGDLKVCLNISEFYIAPVGRRAGQGRELLELLEQWGRTHRACRMSAEVDKDQYLANLFWSSINGIELDNRGERNVYHRIIPPL